MLSTYLPPAWGTVRIRQSPRTGPWSTDGRAVLGAFHLSPSELPPDDPSGARDDALALLYAGDIGHRFDLVLTRPALWREQRVQPVGVGARIGVRHDLPALLVVGCVR